MTGLKDDDVAPCRGDTPRLKGDEIDALTRELDGGWAVISEHHLEKEFRFPDFKSALAFTNAVGEVAEKKGHHPDIHLSWGRVKLEIFTHAVGGLTRSDFVLAAGIDQAT